MADKFKEAGLWGIAEIDENGKVKCVLSGYLTTKREDSIRYFDIAFKKYAKVWNEKFRSFKVRQKAGEVLAAKLYVKVK